MKKTIYLFILPLVFTLLSYTVNAQYCVSNLYAVGCYSGTDNYKIDNVVLGTINMTSTPCNTSTTNTGYSDLTAAYSTYLFKGQTYNLSYTINSADPSTNYVKVWVDLNNDNTFDNTTELINSVGPVASGVNNQSISIPLSATGGTYRMRIRLASYGSSSSLSTACSSEYLGEALDFNVNIVTKKDIGIDTIYTPGASAILGTNVYPKVRLHNYGDTAITNPLISYRLNNGAPTSNTYYGTIAAGATYDYIFSTYFTVPSVAFSLCANTNLTGDVNHLNDTVCKNVTINTTITKDVGVTVISTPGTSVTAGDSIKPYITFTNYGPNITGPVTVPIVCTINNIVVDSGVYTTTGTLYSGSTYYYTFTKAFAAPATNFTLCVATKLVGDSNTVNDATCKAITSNPITFDAGITVIGGPPNTVIAGNSYNASVTLKNFGNNILYNIPVCYSINGVLKDTASFIGTLAANATTSFSFPNGLVAPATNFNVCFWTKLSNDASHTNDTLCKSVTVSAGVIQNDVGVTAISSPATSVLSSSSQTVKVLLKNFGALSQTNIPVYYQVGTSTAVLGTYTGTLFAGDTATYTFATPFTVPSGSSFNFCAYTLLATDQDVSNDKACIVSYVGSIPGAAGTITCLTAGGGHQLYFHVGETASQTLSFHIGKVTGATSYLWSYSGTGATINGTDSNVTVTFVPGATTGNLTVKGVNSFGNGTASATFAIAIENNSTHSINEYNGAGNFNLYPSPTTDKLNISGDFNKQGATKFSIYNLQGAQQYTEESMLDASATKTINVSKLSSGVYFLKIENTKGISYIKFVRQ